MLILSGQLDTGGKAMVPDGLCPTRITVVIVEVAKEHHRRHPLLEHSRNNGGLQCVLQNGFRGSRRAETRPRRIHPVGKAAPVAGVADPGRGAQPLSEHFFSRGVGIGFESVRSYPAFEGCGPKAKCGNRGHRSRLQGRLGRLRQRVFFCS